MPSGNATQSASTVGTSDSTTLSEAIERIGFGRFQRRLMWVCGASWAADAMEVLLIGLAFPSLAADWGLTPTERGQLASVLFLGMLAGAWFWGMFSDYRGRRFAFIVTIGLDSLFGLLSALSPNYTVLLIFRFLTGLGVGGTLPVDYAMFSEYLPIRNRGRYLVYLESFWALGTIVAAGLAWMIVPNLPQVGWRYLLAASALPGLIVFWIRRAMPESPRHLLVHGQEEAARRVLQRVAAENGVQVSIPRLRLEPRPTQVPLSTIWRGAFFSQTVMTTIAWFMISLGYYGVFTWLPTIFGGKGFTIQNAYQNTFVLALAQLPGYFSAAWLVERWGRVRTLGLYLFGSALATYAFATVSSQASNIIASVVMSFFCLGAWGVLYAYTPELYPTSARGTGMGWAGGVARIAGVVAPVLGAQLLAVDLTLALTVYAVTFGVAGGAVLLLGRETMRQALADVASQA